MNEKLSVGPGAYVVPSFHGDDGAPFLVIVNRLEVEGGIVPPDADLYLPDLRLYWSAEGFVTPVRHAVIDAADLDEAYWQGVRALWSPCDVERAARHDPATVVPAHGVVMRGRRLQEALRPVDGRACEAVATPEELAGALRGVRATQAGESVAADPGQRDAQSRSDPGFVHQHQR